jgi:hypothetical protein
LVFSILQLWLEVVDVVDQRAKMSLPDVVEWASAELAGLTRRIPPHQMVFHFTLSTAAGDSLQQFGSAFYSANPGGDNSKEPVNRLNASYARLVS